MIIGQKIIENDIGQHYLCNYCPKLKKLNPSPPKPLNIDIGQSISSNGSIETPKKNQARATLLLSNLAKFSGLGGDGLSIFSLGQ